MKKLQDAIAQTQEIEAVAKAYGATPDEIRMWQNHFRTHQLPTRDELWGWLEHLLDAADDRCDDQFQI